MLTSSAFNSPVVGHSIRVACCILLLCGKSIRGQERRPESRETETRELAALKVLNDSDWARTVTPSLQDTACTYGNPAFPDLYPNEKGAGLDAAYPVLPRDPVKPDGSQYLIRFQSAKPVQTAVEDLIAGGNKWSAYSVEKRHVSQDDGPTDLAIPRYNNADMITVAVILKRPSSDGANLFDYGYEENGRSFPSRSFRVWPCAGLRTAGRQVFAHLSGAFGHDGTSKVLQLSFPRLIDGKPLISDSHEKVEFRMVVNQRVFEATFYVNASDVLDGSENTLYLPSAFTDPLEIAQQ
jgi:hypothetical protein